jgi:hypothetical protein
MSAQPAPMWQAWFCGQGAPPVSGLVAGFPAPLSFVALIGGPLGQRFRRGRVSAPFAGEVYSDRDRIARSRNRTGSRSPRCASSMIFFATISVVGSDRLRFVRHPGHHLVHPRRAGLAGLAGLARCPLLVTHSTQAQPLLHPECVSLAERAAIRKATDLR